MSVTINFLEGGRGIELLASGVVVGEEIILANRDAYTRENLVRLRYKIIDRTECTDYRLTAEDVHAIAEQDRKAAEINSDFVFLVVASAPVQYGVSRRWQTLIDDTGMRVELFSDRASADRWLAENLVDTDDD